jgi:hypothetical protein
MYTPHWERFVKNDCMGEMWSLTTVNQTFLNRHDLMSAAIHSLLSSTGIFKGEYEEFSHLVSNSQGNMYLALYHIVRLVHPVLGQTTAQPSQPHPHPHPQQKKAHPFAEHIAKYLDYFQSELCSGRKYSINERVILILSHLHPTWRDALKRKYTTLVSQNGAILPILMECQLEMLSVTLAQWCVEERLELPSAKATGPSASIFALHNRPPKADEAVTTFTDMHLDSAPATLTLGHTNIDTDMVEQAIQQIVCYVDRGSQKSKYPKRSACGLPCHKLE